MKKYKSNSKGKRKISANTHQLSRILLYLSKRKKPINKTKIQRDTLIKHNSFEAGLKFLVDYGLIEKLEIDRTVWGYKLMRKRR